MLRPGVESFAGAVVPALFALLGTDTPEQAVSQSSKGTNAIRAEGFNNPLRFTQFFAV
jgi:hypothetical protein